VGRNVVCDIFTYNFYQHNLTNPTSGPMAILPNVTLTLRSNMTKKRQFFSRHCDICPIAIFCPSTVTFNPVATERPFFAFKKGQGIDNGMGKNWYGLIYLG
jgi:hypothetical protein